MNKPVWTIREAVVSDTPALTECMHAAYAVYASRIEGGCLPPMEVDYAEEISSSPVWVAESNGVLVGGLVLTFQHDCMTVSNVAVHPSFQGNGLGRGLLAFAESEARRRGHAKLRLATHVLLYENVSLYSHLGWSETSRDELRIYMKKTLD